VNKTNQITVYEHSTLYYDRGEPRLSQNQFESLEKFSDKALPYYSLIHHGVKFKEYVGVLQLGRTQIEILPKMDAGTENEKKWRAILIGMLRASGLLPLNAPSSSRLDIHVHSLLHLYFELFLEEISQLQRRGLIRKYRKREGNSSALKGKLLFDKQVQKNAIHLERFYVSYSSYDQQHRLHQIFYQALLLLKKINTNTMLQSRIENILLDFPEQVPLKVNERLFESLQLDRKSAIYHKALQIAKMLLLNYHPDLSSGRHDVLALLFNMNQLWESFVYAGLRRFADDEITVYAQLRRDFWYAKGFGKVNLRPDILIELKDHRRIVLDTKWKMIQWGKPTVEDLRQLYAYHHYFQAQKSALIYPGETQDEPEIRHTGHFSPENENLPKKECSIFKIGVNSDIRQWQKQIAERITTWAESNESIPAFEEKKTQKLEAFGKFEVLTSKVEDV
jgi:5-methylcytosine-specific restriction enzyme subunit McrC